MKNYFLNLEVITPSSLIKILQSNNLPKNGEIWEFTNEIKPLDLYCYLYAKYGPPNGIQNFLRADDSDNLIHWEWTLSGIYGLTSIQGQNFRSEIHLMGDFKGKGLTLEDFLSQIKSDFGNQGKKISEVRKGIEKWTQFVNPYKRIESAVNLHFSKLDELNLNPQEDKVPQATSDKEFETYSQRWSAVAEKYTYAIGLTFGLRSMLPVLAESFVNLILFVLCRSDIKNNERLFKNTIRQQIDIRVQSLHINCIGFHSAVDYSSEECKKFHTLMNERNDLLHGNVEVNKLSIGDVYFNKRVPLFIQYEDFWDKSIGVSMKSVKLESIHEDKKVVDDFIKYILSKLNANIKEQVDIIMEKGQLGFNYKTGRVGVLFPDHIVDFRLKH
ncbi:hypothetical protein [Pectobacterium aroidearum]|uniref:hypothetical protein n=1 Tax=Pectobacterium aroidearum TaxID=1201031 RepID=UPI0015DE860F|nr:hypothetical protein [Pectobacterium aroidearum]MBA0203683.1 hypothetical protein [Pectobacterium aroidearum]